MSTIKITILLKHSFNKNKNEMKFKLINKIQVINFNYILINTIKVKILKYALRIQCKKP